jgi:hypothetical protein
MGALGIWGAGNKRLWGWGVSIASQFLWTAYALITRQYGFLVGVALYTTVFVRNYVKWRTLGTR